MPSDEERLEALARLLPDTADEEIDCDLWMDRVGLYIRAVRDHSELDDTIRQVVQHLEICPECREEFEALLTAEGLDPSRFKGISRSGTRPGPAS